jgi:hypothetical protein
MHTRSLFTNFGYFSFERKHHHMTPTPDLNALGSAAAQAVTTYNTDQGAVVKDTQQLTADQQLAATDGAAAATLVQNLITAATQVLVGLPAPPAPPAS